MILFSTIANGELNHSSEVLSEVYHLSLDAFGNLTQSYTASTIWGNLLDPLGAFESFYQLSLLSFPASLPCLLIAISSNTRFRGPVSDVSQESLNSVK